MAITPASLEKLKSGSISKVIESLGSKLKRVGREFVTTCVWHEDTNPSLTINDDKGFCFCHVCLYHVANYLDLLNLHLFLHQSL